MLSGREGGTKLPRDPPGLAEPQGTHSRQLAVAHRGRHRCAFRQYTGLDAVARRTVLRCTTAGRERGHGSPAEAPVSNHCRRVGRCVRTTPRSASRRPVTRSRERCQDSNARTSPRGVCISARWPTSPSTSAYCAKRSAKVLEDRGEHLGCLPQRAIGEPADAVVVRRSSRLGTRRSWRSTRPTGAQRRRHREGHGPGQGTARPWLPRDAGPAAARRAGLPLGRRRHA